MVLERLDRLTPDEAQMTAPQVLEVVFGLVQNMRLVMSGEQMDSVYHLPADYMYSLQMARHRSTVSEVPWVCLLVMMDEFCG